MGISNFPAALQPIIQQGFLEREFQQALSARLGYRAIADREDVAVGIGETLTATVVLANLPMVNGLSSFLIQKANVPLNTWQEIAGGRGYGAGTYSIQLGNGSYYISMGVGNGDEVGAIPSLSGTFASFTVPAPGAAALVGVAGLMTRRRKA